MSPSDLRLLTRAYMFAARAHAGQVRKGVSGIPYINHCCEVAELVAEAGGSFETVLAAVLHDVIEDSDTSEAEISAIFGPVVAARVRSMTNPPEWEPLARAETKALQAKHMKDAEDAVRRIKIADQTSNLRDIAREPDAWDSEDAASYVEGAELVVAACRGVDPVLEATFDATVAEAMAKIGGKA
jgi:(p)ppGpp synthase/HD superfamily hydrolase